MPKPSELRLIKRCRLFCPRDGEKFPHITRGLYVLYKKGQPSPGKKKDLMLFILASQVAERIRIEASMPA